MTHRLRGDVTLGRRRAMSEMPEVRLAQKGGEAVPSGQMSRETAGGDRSQPSHQ
jgi:hypothetical protein